MVRLIVMVMLVVLLSACSGNPLTPTGKLVKRAITLQVEQTSVQLSKQLEVDFKGFEIKHLAIRQQKYQIINTLPAYRVQGTYDLKLKLPNRELMQDKKPFDIYMQLQKEGKTWRLLQPDNTQPEEKTEAAKPTWRSYLIE
jgi:hypothetical protein